jgi:hypothetical protein
VNLFAAGSVGEMFGALEDWLGQIVRRPQVGEGSLG